MERRKSITLPIGYMEWNIYFLEDSIISIQDWDNWKMYRLQMIYDKVFTVNKTEEVKEILKSIWYNL